MGYWRNLTIKQGTIIMEENENYSWVETHKEIVEFLKSKENSQNELIDLLKNIGIKLNRDDEKNVSENELSEIDPFTFFRYFYKYGSLKRLEFLQRFAKVIKTKNIPIDTNGVPSARAEKLHLFPYKSQRKNNEIKRLWNLFFKTLSGDLNDKIFEDILKINSIGPVTLTEGLFNILPKTFFPINGPTKPFLMEKLNINPKFTSFTEYKLILDKIKKITDKPFYKISHEAWEWTDNKKKAPSNKNLVITKSIVNHWIVPSNPSKYNAIEAFKDLKMIDWGSSNNINIGDIVYIYVSEKIQSICLKTKVVKIAVEPHEIINDSKYVSELDKIGEKNNYNRLELLQIFDIEQQKKLTFPMLQRHGLKSKIQRNEKLKRELLQYIQSVEKSNIPIKKTINPPSNFILYGPPGTGKTYKTVDISASIIGGVEIGIKNIDDIIDYDMVDEEKFHNKNTEIFNAGLSEKGDKEKGVNGNTVHFVTFHQNYSYEEFVGGLRPVLDKKKSDGNLQFEWKPGIFIKACAKALELARVDTTDKITSPEEWFFGECSNYESGNYKYKDDPKCEKIDKVVLIIDEINRANISRVFGELITLIEDDKRIGGKHQLILTLPNGDKKFGVPANLIIMGTMNTADKSLALLDVALRRRFEFKDLFPKPNLAGVHEEILIKLNKEIGKHRKTPNLLIGHSYFMNNNKMENNEFLKHVFNNKVIPLLNEYFMGNGVKVIELLKKADIHCKEPLEDNNYVVQFDKHDPSKPKKNEEE